MIGAAGRLLLILLPALWLSACGSKPTAVPSPPPERPPAVAPVPVGPAQGPAPLPGASGRVAGRNDRLLVYLPAPGDRLSAIAERFLGQSSLAWRIADANGQRWQLDGATQAPLVVPLGSTGNATGVDADGVQTVPILCYHRLGSGQSKMIVAPAQFEAQLDWLARNHYTVLRLSDLNAFLAGRQALPQRSVVITFDDGYESVYRYAFPALKKYGFVGTLFVYTDFIESRDGLSWSQLQEMAASGLMDIQAHSKSHRNLIERGPTESDAIYRRNMEAEALTPRTVLERRLAALGVKVRHYAYPFGDANDVVLEALQRNAYELGVTVNPGGNAFYAQPLMLRRTMIFGDHDLEAFKARVQLRKGLGRP